MARVLVTGALGNVGREVARACAAGGFTVRLAGRDEKPLRESLPGHEAVRLDFFDRSTWAAALEGCDFVFLLRPPPVSDMAATLNPFIDAAFAAGVKHVVFLSVAGADKMGWVPHRKVELHLEKTGQAWTLLRPGFFAQNLQDAYRLDLLEDGRLYVPAAAGRVAFLDVRDAAEITARIFADPAAYRGRAITLTGPEAITFEEVAGTLSGVLGRPIRYVAASVAGYAWHLRSRRKMPWMQIVVQTFLHFGLRRGDAEQVDPTAERLLGRPPYSMKQYVEHAAAAWKQPG